MKNRIFILILSVFIQLSVFAQIGDGFDPDNPSDPGQPKLKYTLTLKASPTNGGSFNFSSKKIEAESNVYLYAYPSTDFKFVAWLSSDGDTLSTSQSYSLLMPAANTEITGVFVYAPSNPGNPDEQPLKRTLSLVAQPSNGGSFNFSNGKVEIGSVRDLYAYTSSDFVFKFWTINDSVISSENKLNFTMPSENTVIVGHFSYNPSSPSNPGANYFNALTGEVIVDDFKAGQLNSTISSLVNTNGGNNSSVSMITVAGVMNSNDFGIVNYFENCAILDLSRVTGITHIPSYAFDYTNLETVHLPASIQSIGYKAFDQCTNLSSLICHSMTPPVLAQYVFDGVSDGLVVYVPASSLALYQQTDVWKDFTLMPLAENVCKVTVAFPDSVDISDYAQMWLEMVNKKNGQKVHYVLSENNNTYTFNNVVTNTSWDVIVRNQSGDIFASVKNVEITESDTTVTFSSLSKPQNITLSVQSAKGEDLTSQIQISWFDDFNNYISQTNVLTTQPIGKKLKYQIILPQDLSMKYIVPQTYEYTVKENGNNIVWQLQNIKTVHLSGVVKDLMNDTILANASISVIQTFAGKYSKTLTAKTDTSGAYDIEISNVPTSVIFAMDEYISQTINIDSLLTDDIEELVLDDVYLKAISGAVVTVGFTFTPSVVEDSTAKVQNWYDDYNNVSYSIFNKTKNKAIESFNVQYPKIVLLEEVDEDDIIRIRVNSKTSSFKQVEALTTIDSKQRANIVFDIVELGKINAGYNSTENDNIVASLYDSDGKLVNTYNYDNSSLTISNLTDGTYTLITMASSKFFNSVYDLEQLLQSQLQENTDYVKDSVEVASGKISVVAIDTVPLLDESKLYYTGDNTSFTVNKSNIVIGNFLTLTGKVDFKTEYSQHVSNFRMIVDCPNNADFVENSVMVGNSIGSYYVEGKRITIPMDYYTDRVRFCIIPKVGGNYSPSAFIQFDLDGQTITQPIGSAVYTAQNLSINAPQVIAQPTFNVSGTAYSFSEVKVYDNGVLIGQTKSLANGNWVALCELNSPYNLSSHLIYAEVVTKQGLELQSETVKVIYDENAVQASTVTMSFYNKWLKDNVEVLFDFENSITSPTSYMFYTGTDVTFVAKLNKEGSSDIEDVTINVFTDKNEVRSLTTQYDSKKDIWIAIDKFESDNLPINVSVDIKYSNYNMCDTMTFKDALNMVFSKFDISVLDVQTNSMLYTITPYDNTYMSQCIYYNAPLSRKDSLLNFITHSTFTQFKLSDTNSSETYYYGNNAHLILIQDTSNVYLFALYDAKDSLACNTWYNKLIDEKNWIQTTEQISKIFTYDPYATHIEPSTDALNRWRDHIIQDAIDEVNRKLPCADDETLIGLNTAIKDLRQSVGFSLGSFLASTLNLAGSASSRPSRAADGIFQAWETYSDTRDFGAGMEGLTARGKYCLDIIHAAPYCDDPYDDGSVPPSNPPCPPSTPIHDPSGFVYEGVESNRLEGVTATCYYKDYIEDMYGELQEMSVIWDAEQYAQENPLFTDANGMYRWDVPQGMWQVKFEKDGYVTAYSEWLPVPPPQLEVNVGMVQSRQPEVKSARAYEDAVEVEFDKYMITNLLSTDNIIIMQNNEKVEGTLQLLNEEKSPSDDNETFASKVRFTANEKFTASQITLMISNRVQSYAGVTMQNDYSQIFTIEYELKEIVCDSVETLLYRRNKDITVQVLPKEAAIGKTLNVKSSSDMILGLNDTSFELDDDGYATFNVSGELPGTATLTFSVEGYENITSSMVINVENVICNIQITNIDTVVCGEFSYNDSLYTQSTVIYDTFQAENYCDSVIAIKLTVGQTEYTALEVNKCAGDTYTFNGVEYTESQTIIDTLQTVNGCDSIVQITLTINNVISTSIDTTICSNGEFVYNGNTYSESATIIDTLQGYMGCDSIITITLNVAQPIVASIDTSVCGEFTYNNMSYTSSATIYDTLQSYQGCDSILTINFTVNETKKTEIDTVVCEEFVYKGKTYVTSATINETLQTYQGCDSVVTINLTVNHSVQTSIDTVVCEEFSYNGQIYSASTVIEDTFVSYSGCDSIIKINLTVTQPVTLDLEEYVCPGESFTYLGQDYIAGEYEIVIPQASGCDSIVILKVKEYDAIEETIVYDTVVKDSLINDSELSTTDTVWGVNDTVVTTLQSMITGCDSVVTVITSYAFIPQSGLIEINNCNNISVYPNPAKDFVTVDLGGLTAAKNMEISVLNSLGQSVYKSEIQDIKFNIDLHSLAKGVYYIRITNANNTNAIITKKLIIK